MPQATCPHCQAVVSFTEDERGNIVPCSRCEQRFRLPASKAARPQRSSGDEDAADDDGRSARKKRGPNWLLLGLLGGGLVVLLCAGVAGLGIYYMATAGSNFSDRRPDLIQESRLPMPQL